MKNKTKFVIGIILWLSIGLLGIVLGWECFMAYVIGTYIYIIFVSPFEEEKE